jgi:Tfp pilus assembly protein PilF
MSKKRRRKQPHRPPPPAAAPAVHEPVHAPVEPAGELDLESVLSPVLTNRVVWAAVALVVLNVAVFSGLRHHEFIGLDDAGYVRDNPHVISGLSWSNLAWAWTTGYAANWHPLTWMSHMLDVELFGMTAGAHHVVNLLLHIANTLLLFGVLRRMTGALWRSAFVAALFAVHPLHVESVAWIAERKDVLSTLFWLATLWAYVAYVRRPRWDRYLWVMLALALGLTAKPMLVTLPFVLLLMDVWPLARVREGIGRLLIEKLPLFALAAASSVVTLIVQRHGGAIVALDVLPVHARIAQALVTYATYLGKTFWPAHLMVFYPYSPSFPAWWSAALVGLLTVSALAILTARRHPYIAVGWFWYLGTLVPVIGLIQVGQQAMAERYTYVPLIGVFMMAAWGVPDLAARWPGRRWALRAAALVVTIACAAAARAQVGTWTNSETLWTHALEVMPDNYMAHNELGTIFARQGKADDALQHFEAAVHLEPNFPESHNNLGLQYVTRGKIDEAVQQYRLAVGLKPDFAEAHNNLGYVLMAMDQTDQAIAHYTEALRLKPDFAEAHNNLGFVLAAAKPSRVAEAIPHLLEAVRLKPNFEVAHMYLGLALAGTGKLDEAAAEFKEVLRINPKSDGAQGALDEVMRQKIKKD